MTLAELETGLRRYFGLHPYDNPTNMVRGDDFFKRRLLSEFTDDQIAEVLKKLEQETGRPLKL
jgi:hypothetical protein